MKAAGVILGMCALFAVPVGSVAAGPCSGEIETLTKVLASKDAGAGPASGAQATTGMGAERAQHPPTAAMSEAAHGQATSPEDVRRQTAGRPTAADQAATTGSASQHPPTAAMNEATQGQAAPSTPDQHPPTAAMTQAAQGQTAPGQAGQSRDTMQASLALNRAREFDAQGKEAECMQAIEEARRLAGP